MRPNKFLLPSCKKKKNLSIVSQILPSVPLWPNMTLEADIYSIKNRRSACRLVHVNSVLGWFGSFLHNSDRKKARLAPAFLAEFLG